nr:hypothetical protein CTI12_AA350990 [Tanacetum cinerariifolium]
MACGVQILGLTTSCSFSAFMSQSDDEISSRVIRWRDGYRLFASVSNYGSK